MAQLKDDCFAFGGELMPLADALRVLGERVQPVTGTETVDIRAAPGRILAEDVTAGRDVPPHDNSAVDGYAVYHDDLDAKAETRMPVVGRVAAGHPLGRPAKRGEAVRIFTGAPMPVGADGRQSTGPDTVFMEEDCEPEGDFVRLPPGLKRGSNRRAAGEDVKKGEVILKRGQRLRPQEIGLAASVGRNALLMRKRLRAAVFSTGDEVRDPAGDAPPGCIFDANRFVLMALLENLGARVTDLGILPDRLAAVGDALKRAAPDHDLL
ncbi:MAG TPA: molybdopterin molybdotransferase MoeA, partial [Rhodospirillales bacterium]